MQEQIDALTVQVSELLKTVGTQQTALTNADAKFATLTAEAETAKAKVQSFESQSTELNRQSVDITAMLNQGFGSLSTLVEQVTKLATSSSTGGGGSEGNPLMDLKGLGKPAVFKDTEADFVPKIS